MKKLILCLVFLNPMNFCFAKSQFQFQSNQGKVTYKTKGRPNLVVIEATGKGVEGTLLETEGAVSGELVFKVSTFDSGMKSRDDHALKYLEAEKFPQAKIRFDKLKIPQDVKGEFDFKGFLTMHGVEKEVTGKAEIQLEKGKSVLKGQFQLNFNDYEVNVPAWNGITVAEKVEVTFETVFTTIKKS